MSESKFTKGNWNINFTGKHWNNPDLANIEINFGDDGECVCDTVYDINDAHLIVAAPKMYAMIEALLGNYQVAASIAEREGCETNYGQDKILAGLLLAEARGENER